MVKTKNQVPNISVLFYMFLLVFLQFDVVEAKFSCRPFRFKPPKMWRMDFGFPGEYILTMNGNPHVQKARMNMFHDNPLGWQWHTHQLLLSPHFPREDSSVHFHGDQMVKGMVSVKQSTWAYRTNPKDPWTKNKKPPHPVEIQVFWLT